MFANRSGYDRGVNDFSPEGRIYQLEYAQEAVKLGSMSLAVVTKEGVIMGVEKRVMSSLLEPRSIEKLLEIDSHIGACLSGLTADARTLVDHARLEGQNYWFTYNESMPLRSNVKSIATKVINFSEGSEAQARPFGCSLLIGGFDKSGAQLYVVDPTGSFSRLKAFAIGGGDESANKSLEEEYEEDMSLEQATNLVIRTLKDAMEDALNPTNIDLAKVTAEGYHFFDQEEITAAVETAMENYDE